MGNNFRMAPAYSGGPVNFAYWGKTIFDLAGLRYSAKLPALREHARDKNVGIIDRVAREGQALHAGGRFLESTPDGREVAALAKEGFPWQASVAIWPEDVQEIAAGEMVNVNGLAFEGPGVVVRRGHLREISFVALGADPDTSALPLAADLAATLPGGLTMRESEKFFQELSREASPENATDEEISRLARELAEREGINLDAATQKIFAERPDLAETWLKNMTGV